MRIKNEFSTILYAVGAIFIVSTAFSMYGKGGGSLYIPVFVMQRLSVSSTISTLLMLNLITDLVAIMVYAKNKLVDCKFYFSFLPRNHIGLDFRSNSLKQVAKEFSSWKFRSFSLCRRFFNDLADDLDYSHPRPRILSHAV